MKRRMKLLGRGLRVLWVLFALSLVVFAVQRVAERGRFTGAYSSYGGGPRGARALYLLAQSLRAQPRRWAQDLAHLPTHGMLIALGGCDSGMARKVSRYERQVLERWVRGGGVLLVAGARHYLPDTLGVSFEDDPACKPHFGFGGSETTDEAARGPRMPMFAPTPSVLPTPPTAATSPRDAGVLAEDTAADGGADPALLAASPGDSPAAGRSSRRGSQSTQRWAIPMAPPLLGMSIVAFRRPGVLKLDSGVKHAVLLASPTAPGAAGEADVAPLAVAVPRGAGFVVVLASASMFQNRDLLQSQGGALFARLLRAYAPAGPVLFDEYHLGVGERRSLMQYLRQAGAMPVALGLLLIAALLLWRAGARFGAVRGQLTAAPSGSASYVSAMARLYQAAGDPAGALDSIVKQALARIASHHHLGTAPAVKLEHALRERAATVAADAVAEIESYRRRVGTQRGRLAQLVQRIDAAVARATVSPVARLPG